MNVSPLCEEELFERGAALVTEKRRERAMRLKNRCAAARLVGAELLLRYALVRDFKIEKLPAIRETGRGKPYFAGLPVHFSLSHSGEYAVCLVSDECEAGADIQLVRSVDLKVAARALSQEAYAELEATAESGRDERFTELWALHESAVKLRGGSVFDRTHSSASKLVKAPDGYKLAVACRRAQ